MEQVTWGLFMRRDHRHTVLTRNQRDSADTALHDQSTDPGYFTLSSANRTYPAVGDTPSLGRETLDIGTMRVVPGASSSLGDAVVKVGDSAA